MSVKEVREKATKGQRLEKSILAEGRAAKAEARGRTACCVLERAKMPAWLECGKGEGLAVRPKAGPYVQFEDSCFLHLSDSKAISGC